MDSQTLARRLRLIAAILLAVAAVIAGGTKAAHAATQPDLTNGRAHVIVGRPAGTNRPLRRIYPANAREPRGVTLLLARSSVPHYWETYELDTVRAWAARRGWRTQEAKHGGIDTTPNLVGKEYRVDRHLRTALNATARKAGTTCTIISGWRDSSLQVHLWMLYLSGMGNPANRPGTSRHEAPARGTSAGAADTYCNGIAFYAYATRHDVWTFAYSRGLRTPYNPREPWHEEYATTAK
jgi:hypothetical protein